MSQPQTALLSTLGTKVNINENYVVLLPDTDHIVVVAGARYPDAASNFEHPAVAAKIKRVAHTRAYWPDGRKKWFAHPIVDYFFVIPKDRIELVFEEGHSYVPVNINGARYRFNVTGGGAAQWTDWVNQVAHVGIGFTLKKLKGLAEVALTVEEVKQRGIKFPIEAPDSDEDRHFTDLVAGFVCRDKLKPGDKLVIQDSHHFNITDSKEFVIVERNAKRRNFHVWLIEGASRGKVPYSGVNWTATAKANNLPLDSSGLENYLEAA